ncbi:MAG: hypothetical protein VX498_13465 [Myxococcota bacterium]|nr:hypothetical protein [Myxococcota bacterium]
MLIQETLSNLGWLGFGAGCIALALAYIYSIVWVGRDARSRGIQKAWVLQVVTALQFPWVWLMYLLVTRSLDERDRNESIESRI